MPGTWLAERRESAAAAARSLPVPTLRDEPWRYTTLRGIDFAGYTVPAEEPAPVDSGTILTGSEAGRIVQSDATTIVSELDEALTAQGVIFAPLDRAAEEHADLVEAHLGRIVGTGEHFAAENAALWTGGALLYVPRNVAVELPLHVTFSIATPQAAQHWRLLVIAEEGSSCTLIEEHSDAAPGYANGVAELVVGPNAKIEYVVVQNRDVETLHFAHHRAEIARDAELDWVACSLGSKTGKTRMESRLIGPGSRAKLTGTYVIGGSQHLDLDTTQEHDAPSATSDLAFKGVLVGQSRSVWRGIIKVAQGAHRTDAYQENRNLLLSERAHADSIPGLQILANDVRCTHGATIGRVDQELLHYLMARGLPRPEATRMIVQGFFAEVLERIGSEPVRDAVARALEAKLP